MFVIERLIQFYNRYKYSLNGIWGGLVSVHQSSLVNALESRNPTALVHVLNNDEGFYHGLDGSSVRQWNDILLPMLAQRIGLLPFPNPEQPFKSDDVNKQDVERYLGLKLTPPDCFHFRNSDGLIPPRLFYCYSAAFTILRYLGCAPESLLEIGAGFGWMGYIAWQWKCPYTVIDLPSVVVLSAYFMSKVCGEERVWLCGESQNADAFARFYPSNHYEHLCGPYKVIYNNDSLPEMAPLERAAYIELIGKMLAENGFFLSINHESPTSGQRGVFASASRLNLRLRSSFMMRAGYLEEIYDTGS